eukprot:4339877-Alexandrium_andersonii.AAC.1
MSMMWRALLCVHWRGRGNPGGPEYSDTGPSSEEAEEGREPKVARGPAAPADEERKRHERTR